MALILAYQNRGLSRNITITDVSGATITPTVVDKVRAIIGREGETAKLTVSSDAPTANGSSFTKGATNLLRLDASDLTFDAGVYSLYIDYYDGSDADEWKTVSRQVFCLELT